MKWWLLLVLAVTGGCQQFLPPVHLNTTNTLPQIIQWNSFEFEPNGESLWLEEAKKRFKKPILFSCHGGPGFYPRKNHKGEDEYVEMWCVFPDEPRKKMPVEDVASMLHNLYPDHDIILLVCNRTGFDIRVPRVWYARAKCWHVPDGYYGPFREGERDKGSVGNIWEFVTWDGRHEGKITEPDQWQIFLQRLRSSTDWLRQLSNRAKS